MTLDDTEDTDPTLIVQREGRAAARRGGAVTLDETTPRPRRTADDEATVRVRRTAMEPTGTDPGVEESTSESGRIASSPDHDALKSPYAARPVAPVIAVRAEHHPPMAQSSVDGEAVDRSIRGKARRRVAGLALIVTGAICVLAGLLAILIVGLG